MKVLFLLSLAAAVTQEFQYMEVQELSEAESAAEKKCGFCHDQALVCEKSDSNCLNGYGSQGGLNCPNGRCCQCVPNIMKSFCLQYDSPKGKIVTTYGPQVHNLFSYEATVSQDIVFTPSCSEAYCAHKKCRYAPRLIGCGSMQGNPRLHGFQVLQYGQWLCDNLDHGSAFIGCGSVYSNLNTKTARASKLIGIVTPASPVIGCEKNHKVTIYSNLYISSPTWNYLAIIELFNEVLLVAQQQQDLTARVQQLEYAVEQLVVITVLLWAVFIVFVLCYYGLSVHEFIDLVSSRKVAALAHAIFKMFFKIPDCPFKDSLAAAIAVITSLVEPFKVDCAGGQAHRQLAKDVFA